MKLLTNSILRRLIANSEKSAPIDGGFDHKPVVKLFDPSGAATWLLTEIDPQQHNFAFALEDLGDGRIWLGYVSLKNIEAMRSPLGPSIERDLHFTADKTIGAYAAAARLAGRIVA